MLRSPDLVGHLPHGRETFFGRRASPELALQRRVLASGDAAARPGPAPKGRTHRAIHSLILARSRRSVAVSFGTMVSSKATTVAKYLAELPPDRRAAIAKVREAILASLRTDTQNFQAFKRRVQSLPAATQAAR